MITLRAFMDESGTHDQSPILLIAGVVSTKGKWRIFDKKWREVLADHSVDFVHGKDLRKSTGAFFGWSDAKQNDFSSRLLDISYRYVGFGLTMRLDRNDFKEVYREGERPRKLQLQSAYGLLFRAWVEQARRIANELYADQAASGIYVMLEEGPKAGAAMDVFRDMRNAQTIADGIPLKGFAIGDKSYPGLQLADMTAHRGWIAEKREDTKFHKLEEPVSVRDVKRRIGEPMAVYRLQLDREFLAAVKEGILAEDAWRIEYGRRKASGEI